MRIICQSFRRHGIFLLKTLFSVCHNFSEFHRFSLFFCSLWLSVVVIIKILCAHCLNLELLKKKKKLKIIKTIVVKTLPYARQNGRLSDNKNKKEQAVNFIKVWKKSMVYLRNDKKFNSIEMQCTEKER